MIKIYDEYDSYLDGGYFSSPRKNLGNKLFIYAGCRIISELLGYELIAPKNALIRREDTITGNYKEIIFPFDSVPGKVIENPIKIINDIDIVNLGSIENLINEYPKHGFLNMSYFSKYDYIKPYKSIVKNFYNRLINPKKLNNDIVIMLRSSNHDGSFVLPDNYYLDILEKENFDNLYVSFDHKNMHHRLLEKLKIYDPKFIDGDILDVFSEITSYNKIIAAQGTFSFWASFLSSADTIYWPITNDGPNSGKNSSSTVFNTYVNLVVDDEIRYKHINVNNIYEV